MKKITDINYAKLDLLIKAFCKRRKYKISDNESDFFIYKKFRTIYTPDKTQTIEYYQKVFSLIAEIEGARNKKEAEFVSYSLLEFFNISKQLPATLLIGKTCLETLEFINVCSNVYSNLILMYSCFDAEV